MQRLLSLLVLLALGIVSTNAVAGSYPDRPVKLVVSFPEQSQANLFAKALAERLQAGLGQPVMVVNVPGFSGSRALDHVAGAWPNGYTLGLASDAALTTNLLIYQDLPYDPVYDVKPIGRLLTIPSVIVVSGGSPFKALHDVISAARARPGLLSFAHAGTGSPSHVAGRLLAIRSHTDLRSVHVTNPAQYGKFIGDDPMTFGVVSVQEVLPFVKAGILRPLAVTSLQRSIQLPDVPTVAESGFTGQDASAWFGLVAPRGTPDEVVERLNAEGTKAQLYPGLANALTAMGAQGATVSPDEMRDRIRRRLAELRPLLADGDYGE